jgi:acyl-CoA dehydrogenase family protein 9
MDAFTAAMLENHPLANTAIETSHCKLFGTTRAWDVLYDALQVAGGSGFLSTQPYEKRMRDFRVTPIFEGTTEIHSIYPALFALRRMTKGRGAGRNPLPSLLASLHKHLSPFSKWPLPAEDPVMRRAARLARRNARTIGRLLLSGSLLHGRRIGQKELLLRRITTLSLYTYGLLAVLAKMEADRRRGELHSDEREMLDYFVEEAAQARRESKRLADSRRERLTAGLSGFSH